MRKLIFKITAILSIFFCNMSFSQSYDYHQGYIFDQKYIKRISLAQAEKIVAISGVFNPFLSWNWGDEKKIGSSQLERSGDRLIIKFENKSPLSLRDFSINEGDGDSQLFKYLKSVPGYHIIGVVFGHDQPAFLLINETGSDFYFVDTN